MADGNFPTGEAVLILLSGLPGSGKTTFAKVLAERVALCHVERDAVRRGLAPEPTYSFSESGRVFAIVEAEARKALTSGRHALVDATSLTTRDRKRFVKLAAVLGAPLVAVRLTAPDAVIRERLAKARDGHSQAGVQVYEKMRGRAQPFASAVVVIDTRFGLEPGLGLVLRLIEGANGG